MSSFNSSAEIHLYSLFMPQAKVSLGGIPAICVCVCCVFLATCCLDSALMLLGSSSNTTKPTTHHNNLSVCVCSLQVRNVICPVSLSAPSHVRGVLFTELAFSHRTRRQAAAVQMMTLCSYTAISLFKATNQRSGCCDIMPTVRGRRVLVLAVVSVLQQTCCFGASCFWV